MTKKRRELTTASVRSLVAKQLAALLPKRRYKLFPSTYKELWDYVVELLKITQRGEESWICDSAFHRACEILIAYKLLSRAELRAIIGSAIERSR